MVLLSLKINALIEDFRKSIPMDSATARAIDRKDSRRKILLYAKAEGHLKFAQELEGALSGKPARETEDDKAAFPIFANSKISST
ncbi:MAG: hypothetical protein ACREV9_03185 [Burkholderiales bacterium]